MRILKMQGFTLLEMMSAVLASSIIVLSALFFFYGEIQSIQKEHEYQLERLEKTIENYKELRRKIISKG